jgi:hypothetical protein
VADEGISAGKVFVEVTARSTGFWARFVADNQAGASKAGDDLGDRIGKAIAARVAKSIRDGLTSAGTGVGAQGAKYGESFGGTFANTAKKRIEAALKSLPTPQIGVATSEAEQKLKDLRGDLSTLSGKKIGVDIGAGEALDEVRRLKTALDELAGKSPNVQVRVDAANAAVELAAVDREITRLDGRRADVNINTNAGEAAGGLQSVLNAGAALGPAIIPGAAAGAAAILGIGTSALAAAPAVGVLALAFHGIGGAVSALNAADQASAKTGNTLVQQQKSLSSSADQVRSAEASLANTRANAADSQRRSLQQIADAERAVGQAQQDAKRAQDDLNTARDEERRSQQDTAFQLRQNAIDQKKAALDVAAAQKAAALGGDGNKTALDEALLRQEELKVAGERLAAEQQRNARTGVEGSKRVTAAQEAVVKSQQKITDAERAVTDARAQAASQARQSAFAIAQAQQAVATASRSAGAATVAAAATGGAAVDKLNDALADLPVSGQAFARFIYGLKPTLLDLQAAAADGLLPGVQEGIQTLLPYVGNLRGFIGGVSGELGTLARRGAETFTNPFWRQFFSYIGSQAVPTLDTLFQVSVNVAEGGARIIQAFSPFERQVGGGIASVSQKFLAFSQGLDHNQGFQRFIQYALTEGPHVVATIEELAKVGLHVAEAYAPVGSVVVTELRLLGAVINAIPVPVITTLATAITAYKTASLLTGGAQALLNSGLLTGITRMVTYKTVTDAAGVATTGMQRAVGAAGGFIGGPFLLAITAAVTVIGLLAERQAQAKVNTDSYRSTLEDYARTFKDGVTPAALESAKAILANNQALRGLVEVTQSHGISATEVVAGLNGEADAREKVVAAIDDHIGALAIKAGYESGDARKADKAQIESLEAMKQAFLDSGANAAEAGRLTGELADEQSRANGVFDQASPVVKTLADSYKIVADATSTAAQKTDALRQAEDALFGSARAADEAAEAQAKAIRASNKTLDDRALLGEKGAKSLDLNTEAGTRLRDSLKEELTAINNTYRANIANGVSIAEATQQHDAEVEALKRKSAQKGVDAGATQHLIDIYGKVPTSASTDVTVTGIGATKTQLDELLAYQLALRTGITIGEARDKINPQVRSPGGQGQARPNTLAEGGPVVGPGTGTSDDVPAIERSTGARFQLSNGEFVQPTASVDYYGQGFMEQIRRRELPREAVRGFATGGLINQLLTDHYPYPTTTAMTKIPSKADVAKAITEGPSSGGSEDIKAFIRSTGSLPYIWANAGPAGYDCSGLASAVYGLVTGKGGGHGQRYFTTYDFANGAPAGFKPGAGGVLTVGVNPTTHMAGNYGGLGFEAASTRSGIKIGNRAQPTSNFQKQFHLAGGGLVSTKVLDELGLDVGGDPSGLTVDGRKVPLGVFDSGGLLPTGMSLAYNGTGQPEVIRTQQQEQALGDPQFDITVMLGTREITDIVDVRVERATSRIARSVGSGVRT